MPNDIEKDTAIAVLRNERIALSDQITELTIQVHILRNQLEQLNAIHEKREEGLSS